MLSRRFIFKAFFFLLFLLLLVFLYVYTHTHTRLGDKGRGEACVRVCDVVKQEIDIPYFCPPPQFPVVFF